MVVPIECVDSIESPLQDRRSSVVHLFPRSCAHSAAWESMSPEVKERITPWIKIPPIPWDHKNDIPAKTIDEHLLKVDGKFEKSWGSDQLFFVDLMRIGERERMSDGTHPLAHLFNRARIRTLKAVPVTGLIRDDAYQEACREIVREDKRGVCLRLQKDDFEEAGSLEFAIAKLLEL